MRGRLWIPTAAAFLLTFGVCASIYGSELDIELLRPELVELPPEALRVFKEAAEECRKEYQLSGGAANEGIRRALEQGRLVGRIHPEHRMLLFKGRRMGNLTKREFDAAVKKFYETVQDGSFLWAAIFRHHIAMQQWLLFLTGEAFLCAGEYEGAVECFALARGPLITFRMQGTVGGGKEYRERKSREHQSGAATFMRLETTFVCTAITDTWLAKHASRRIDGVASLLHYPRTAYQAARALIRKRRIAAAYRVLKSISEAKTPDRYKEGYVESAAALAKIIETRASALFQDLRDSLKEGRGLHYEMALKEVRGPYESFADFPALRSEYATFLQDPSTVSMQREMAAQAALDEALKKDPERSATAFLGALEKISKLHPGTVAAKDASYRVRALRHDQAFMKRVIAAECEVLVSQAENFERVGLRAKAVAIYGNLLKRYPDAACASEVRERLGQLQQNANRVKDDVSIGGR